MSRSFNGSSQYLYFSTNPDDFPVQSVPLTLACWFKSTTLSGQQLLMSIGNKKSSAQRNCWMLTASGQIGGDPVSARSADTEGISTASTTIGYSINTWHHAVATFAASNDRSAYIDGGSKGVDSASRAVSSPDLLSLGAHLQGTSPSINLSGVIAQAAVWSAALTDDEVASLYNNGIGLSPTLVRPDALVAYYPLLQTDGDIDWWGQNNLTANGSPTYADHVPVIYPSGVRSVVTSAGPSFKAAWARGSNVIITPGVI